MGVPLIEAEGLGKVYDRAFSPLGLLQRLADGLVRAVGREPARSLRAVDDLSFVVRGGGVVGFLGPNGAGKTTTLKMLLGFLHPTRGSVRLFGHELAREHAAIFARTGGLIDRPNFYEYLTGRRNLELRACLYPAVTPRRLAAVLEDVELTWAADRRVATYSTGMLQRLGLASAMLHEPELLVLDEPTRGLDPKGQAEVRTILKRIVARGHTTIFLSSHLLHEVELLCDGVVIIDRGRLIHQGRVSELLGGSGEVVRAVVDDRDRAERVLRDCKDVASVERSDEGGPHLKVTARSGGAPRVAELLVKNGVALQELAPVRQSLEEFFLKVTSGTGEAGGGAA